MVVVVARVRHDVDPHVGHAHDAVALRERLVRLEVGVVPDVHDDAVGEHRRLPPRVRERPPRARLLAVLAHEPEHRVGERAEVLRRLLVVLVRPDVQVRPREDGIVPVQVLAVEPVEELQESRRLEVEVVLAVLLAREIRTVLREAERMGRRVDLGNDRHALRRGPLHERAELVLRVAAVLRRQARIGLALETERRVPAAVVVEMHVELVHLVARELVDDAVEEGHRIVLAPDVQHRAADAVLRLIPHDALAHRHAPELLQRLASPQKPPLALGDKRRAGLRERQHVALVGGDVEPRIDLLVRRAREDELLRARLDGVVRHLRHDRQRVERSPIDEPHAVVVRPRNAARVARGAPVALENHHDRLAARLVRRIPQVLRPLPDALEGKGRRTALGLGRQVPAATRLAPVLRQELLHYIHVGDVIDRGGRILHPRVVLARDALPFRLGDGMRRKGRRGNKN